MKKVEQKSKGARVTCPFAQACDASIADFGFDAKILSSARAGPVGIVRFEIT